MAGTPRDTPTPMPIRSDFPNSLCGSVEEAGIVDEALEVVAAVAFELGDVRADSSLIVLVDRSLVGVAAGCAEVVDAAATSVVTSAGPSWSSRVLVEVAWRAEYKPSSRFVKRTV